MAQTYNNSYQTEKNKKKSEKSESMLSLLFPLQRQWCSLEDTTNTGKSLSEALIFPSTNPQYDDRLFFELQVQYMKITSSEHVVYTNCILFLS